LSGRLAALPLQIRAALPQWRLREARCPPPARAPSLLLMLVLVRVLDGLLSQPPLHERPAPQVITLSPPAVRVHVLPRCPVEPAPGRQRQAGQVAGGGPGQQVRARVMVVGVARRPLLRVGSDLLGGGLLLLAADGKAVCGIGIAR